MKETEAVRRELSKSEVERLFTGAVDDTLSDADQATLEAHPELRARLAQYRRAVSLLRQAPREKAPDALASMILRRTRRRRQHARDLHHATWRVPAEVVVPLVIAALVALFMVLASP
jgi:anti-sigma factor RsiW